MSLDVSLAACDVPDAQLIHAALKKTINVAAVIFPPCAQQQRHGLFAIRTDSKTAIEHAIPIKTADGAVENQRNMMPSTIIDRRIRQRASRLKTQCAISLNIRAKLIMAT